MACTIHVQELLHSRNQGNPSGKRHYTPYNKVFHNGHQMSEIVLHLCAQEITCWPGNQAGFPLHNTGKGSYFLHIIHCADGKDTMLLLIISVIMV